MNEYKHVLLTTIKEDACKILRDRYNKDSFKNE